MKTVLASKSPRRKEILSMLGLEFTVDSADVDEQCSCPDPCGYVEELALRKGKAVAGKYGSDTLVISSDTVVVLDGKILGKPHSEEQAKEMLRSLSGKKHTVASGLSLIVGGKEYTSHETSDVYFAKMTEDVIDAYVATGDPMDKAGAYAVQGKTALWIDKIDGDYFNVMGFPVRLFNKMLEAAGIDTAKLVFG